MAATSAIGLLSLLFTIAIPVSIVFLLLWIYQIKRNTEIQVAQNKEIFQLLTKEKIQ
ncbi:4-hydroxybenzoate polyprenyltransferase [Cytobacillus eiseniae]|uniref:4-hydroxybenzoate polyprenyltransferase n=1 Tax=Cytobacillus eiseniae TaxID=762947 RepID=A0ABS4RDT3_9BACI|nr:hypothetical protein [Cytobacillus eiseniae]MBP2241060.1 4-hydroxybenzoate polyprenyltransferase [Cytobacillus eiseniae]